MAPARKDQDGIYHSLPGTLLYNVRCAGRILFNRMTVRELRELRPEIIEWVWCMETERELEKAEILRLCAGNPLNAVTQPTQRRK